MTEIDFQHWDIVVFLLGQSAIILGALVATYVRIRVTMAELKKDVKAVHDTAVGLGCNHSKLSGQVSGISRGLARLEGHVNAVRPIPPIKDESQF
jgi:hypothetical protein